MEKRGAAISIFSFSRLTAFSAFFFHHHLRRNIRRRGKFLRVEEEVELRQDWGESAAAAAEATR